MLFVDKSNTGTFFFEQLATLPEKVWWVPQATSQVAQKGKFQHLIYLQITKWLMLLMRVLISKHFILSVNAVLKSGNISRTSMDDVDPYIRPIHDTAYITKY